LVPDLYKGKVGVDKEEASHMLSKLDWAAALEEIKQAVQYLRDGGATRVACIGFCMGGALSLAAAQHAGIQCAAPFYGLPGVSDSM
jgi:carboxymethylenebutenolidase